MTNPVASLRHVVHGQSGDWLYDQVLVWCPGCAAAKDGHFGNHGLIVRAPDGSTAPVWGWDENLELPTFSPSLLVQGTVRCHSFILAGHWHYLADCDHELAGQTVPMVPLPDWLAREASS